MRGNFILSVFTSIIMIGITSGEDENYCLEVSYCNLIKGDIARESDKYNKDPSKFYKDAEEGVKLYHSSIKTQDDASKEECKRILATCKTEVAKMAVEDLKFPSKYQDSCDFKSYSRTIFGCKNIPSWPQTIKDVLLKSHKTCRTECVIEDDNKIILSTGKEVNTRSTGAPPKSGDSAVDALDLEQRGLNAQRKYATLISAFEDDISKLGWGELDVCPESSWVNGMDRIERGDYLFYIAFECREIGSPSQTVETIESTVVGNKPEGNATWGPDYAKRLTQICSGLPNKRPGSKPDAFIVGISVTTKQYKTYGKIPLYINFICANSLAWTYPRETSSPPVTNLIPDSKEMVCPNGTAVCALQTKSATFESVSFLIDVRIGCCQGEKDRDLFTYPTPLPTTTPKLTPGGLEDLSNLQKRSDYYLFWDESEVLNDIITRYNIYYSPAQIDNEGDDVESTCQTKPGFIGSYELRDPKSCYFQGRRVPEIIFNCTFKQSNQDVLDIYGRLKTGHTLQDSKYFSANYCDGGYYTGMEFTYYVVKEYPYLVNAWGLKLKCSVGTTSTDHESVMKAYERLDLATLNPVKANANCDPGKAICGFQNKIAHQHLGTFEAFYFKVLCCTIPT